MPRRRKEFIEYEVEDKEEEFDVEDEEEEFAVDEEGVRDCTGDYAEEDDEEEDDDDEDCGGGGSRGRKRRRKSVSQYFDEVAAVGSDDEDEEEIGEDDFIDPESDIPEKDDIDRRIHHRPLLPREDEQEDVEEIERRIRERYGRSFIVEEYDEECDEHEEATYVEQQALLPSVWGPKLWVVKCAIGREREVAVCLMQKCIDLPELQIRSVVALDHLQNYIYIEAYKEAHVKEAIKGMRNIFTNHKIMLVPIKEMADVLSVESKAIDMSRDTWVRMKTGTYKGDLAKVVDLDNVKQRATVKVIPRIDLQALANKLGGREVPNPKRKAFTAPRARFMNVDEARVLHIRVERKRDPATGEYFEKIEGMRFKDGFLYKNVSLKSLITHNVQPTYGELDNFRQSGETVSTLVANRKKGRFMKGDKVIVVKGELRNLKGCVEKVEEDTVHIKPNEKGLPKTLAISDKDLCKCFEAGNHVKVVSGATEGATGMVVSVEGRVVNLVSDTTKELICAFADNVVESSEVKSESCLMNNSLTSRFARLETASPRVPLSPMRPPRGGYSGHSHSNFGGRGHDAIIGASVKIRVGHYKGCKGRVRYVKGSTVGIELESQMKVVAVDRSHISDNVVNTSETTPMHPPCCTPLHPYMTPLRDSGGMLITPFGITPSVPATPYHDGMRTPMRGRAWNPYTPTSPPRMASVG